MLRQEMNIGYFDKLHRPGEKLGVFDNESDFECCAQRVHCNTQHGHFGPDIVWNEEQRRYELKTDEEKTKAYLERFHSTIHGKRHTIMVGGEHNNVYFPGFVQYKERLPEALMQDVDGSYLELHDPDILGGTAIPMPAIDDPQLLKLNAKQLAYMAARLRGCHYVAAYRMGAEMLWPEYFGLGHGDYRPTSWKHFTAWCRLHGETPPEKAETLVEGSAARRLWLHYREQAMADRSAYYFRAILQEDDTHLCFYPTHGSTMLRNDRAKLGQQPDTLAAAADGIEMGHILIDHDEERRNVILTCLNTSYGTPVIVPRLGNKTPDLGMAGGGRSFTPQTLRRLVYEDVGMGIPIIFPIHWRSHLHDGEWFIKDTPAETECRRVFDEITTAAPFMMGMGRMQPQVGILASDETWLRAYDMRWTALMQDMLADGANATIMTDALVEQGLSRRMPLLLLVNDDTVSAETLTRLTAYMDEGGRVLVWGDFAVEQSGREQVLAHPNCRISHVPAAQRVRVIRESFLAGYRDGCNSIRFKVFPVDYAALKAEIADFAPQVVLKPFAVYGAPGKTNFYALTDRAGMGCVCINNGAEDACFSLAPDTRLMPEAQAFDMLTGRRVEMPITLPGYGTRMLYFAPPLPEAWEETLCDAEDAFERWRQMGADCGPLRHDFTSLKTGDHPEKRCAMAKALLESMALLPRWERDAAGNVRVTVTCISAAGVSVTNAQVRLRIAPGSMKQYPLTWNGSAYEAVLPPETFARVYDPDTCDYVPLTGAARLILQAETDAWQGGALLTVHL